MEKTSLYRHFDGEGKLLYVGIAIDPLRRLIQHSKGAWYAKIARIDIEAHDSLEHALYAEAIAIKEESPLYNRRKPYPVHPDDVVKKEKPVFQIENWEPLPGNSNRPTLAYTILPEGADTSARLKAIAATIDGRGFIQADISERGLGFTWVLKFAQQPGCRIITDRPEAFEIAKDLMEKRGLIFEVVSSWAA